MFAADQNDVDAEIFYGRPRTIRCNSTPIDLLGERQACASAKR
jgi:hypothetical protein